MPDDATWTGIGAAVPRIEGRAKVTGQALFAADEPVANPAFAFLVLSTVARGRIRSFDLAGAGGGARASPWGRGAWWCASSGAATPTAPAPSRSTPTP